MLIGDEVQELVGRKAGEVAGAVFAHEAYRRLLCPELSGLFDELTGAAPFLDAVDDVRDREYG